VDREARPRGDREARRRHPRAGRLREDRGQAVFALEQEPAVEEALVAIDAASGEVRALVGGFDFRRSEFDRAIQARRQAGSAFKPIVYTAALMKGLTLSDRVLDAPTVFVEPGTLTPYQPRTTASSTTASSPCARRSRSPPTSRPSTSWTRPATRRSSTWRASSA
jgi:membrane carboxypeptidase/penicillin-binding protein